MKIEHNHRLSEVIEFDVDVFRDSRGYFLETWRRARYLEAGIQENFVQDNESMSEYGVLRGLHYQHPVGQGKLVRVIYGRIVDVAVDVRVGSPTFGQWTMVELDSKAKRQVWIPVGFAHGFCVTSAEAVIAYKCTAPYIPGGEFSIRWDDPDIGIDWPIDRPVVSERDANGCLLRDMADESLPRYEGEQLKPRVA
jgi:dTDP-4-dehydrorhamnose 3,5-epimerase